MPFDNRGIFISARLEMGQLNRAKVRCGTDPSKLPLRLRRPVHDATASAAPKTIRCSRSNASNAWGRLTADPLDDISLATEDPVLVIDSHRLEVGHQRIGHAVHPGEHLAPSLHGQVDVLDALAQFPRHHAGHLAQREVARPGHHVPLAHVEHRVGQDARLVRDQVSVDVIVFERCCS